MSEFEQKVMKSLGGLETSVGDIKETLEKSETVREDHAKRIRSLEGSRKWFKGAWAVSGGLLFLYLKDKGIGNIFS